MAGTFEFDDKIDRLRRQKAENDAIQAGNAEFDATSSALKNDNNAAAHIGTAIAGNLFRRGRKIVDLRF